MNKIQEIVIIAENNAKQRLKLIESTLELIEKDKGLRARINKIDGNFIRKIRHYPGDITTHRIAKILAKTTK